MKGGRFLSLLIAVATLLCGCAGSAVPRETQTMTDGGRGTDSTSAVNPSETVKETEISETYESVSDISVTETDGTAPFTDAESNLEETDVSSEVQDTAFQDTDETPGAATETDRPGGPETTDSGHDTGGGSDQPDAPGGILPADVLGVRDYKSELLLGFEPDILPSVSCSGERCSFAIENGAGVSGSAICLISGQNTAEVYISIPESDLSGFDGVMFYADVSGVTPSKNDSTGVAVRLWASDSVGGNDYMWTRNTITPIVMGHDIAAYYLSSGVWEKCDPDIMNGERVQLPERFKGWVYIPFSSYISNVGPEGRPVAGLRSRRINRIMLLTGPYQSVSGNMENGYRIVFDEIMLIKTGDDDGVGNDGSDTIFLGYDEIGISGRTTCSDGGVVSVYPSENGQGLSVSALKNGSVSVTVTDAWGHTASFDAIVKGGRMNSVTVTKKYSEKSAVNVKAFGATGNGRADDTVAIQSAINSLKNSGGTVYFPAGIYNITRLVRCDGIRLVLEGNVSDVKEGYTEKLGKRVANGEFAVIRNTLSAANFILNHDPSGSGRNGVGNITITGGMIDLNGSVPSGSQIVDMTVERPEGSASNTCALVFSNASGLLIDNVIFKDNFNGHAFQLTGCSDVLIKDCLFAGYTATSQNMTTRETIQIEYAHSGAIPPSTYDAGEYYFCRNIEITGCCFTNSDKAGYHPIPIGQHGMNREPNCTGLKITDNLFVNPYCYGIRLLSYADVEISGNRFVSDLPGVGDKSGGTQSFIYIPLNMSDVSYTGKLENGSDAKIVYSYRFEHYGTKNVVISGNEFSLCGGSVFRVLYAQAPQLLSAGAESVSGAYRQKSGSLAGLVYTGFVRVSNRIEGLTFSNNRIDYSGAPQFTDFNLCAVNVCDLEVSGNTTTGYSSFSVSSEGISGLKTSGIVSGSEAKKKVLSTDLTDRFIAIPLTDRYVNVVSDGTARTLTLNADEGIDEITVSVTPEGNAEVSVKCSEGYSFAGWDGDVPGVMSSSLTLTALAEK
ncbi:MAG: right-handed parallel beta-helix repeat-containing protein [Clostridia bacterium]|nr:right-handed parallel beta-helix repeat-containing protein [Clostridia bacterium]